VNQAAVVEQEVSVLEPDYPLPLELTTQLPLAVVVLEQVD
jgi:hypothetical protein